MLLTLGEKQVFYLAILGWHFRDKENLISSPRSAHCVTHHMQKEMRKFEKFKFWLLKANLIKRPGIENPIYQTTLEIFPSAIFSNFFFSLSQTVTFSELEEVHFLHCPKDCVVGCIFHLGLSLDNNRHINQQFKAMVPGKSPLFCDLKVSARPPLRQRSPAVHRAPLF